MPHFIPFILLLLLPAWTDEPVHGTPAFPQVFALVANDDSPDEVRLAESKLFRHAQNSPAAAPAHPAEGPPRIARSQSTTPVTLRFRRGTFRIARVQYRGGGDWYSSPTALTNLIRHARETLPIPIDPEYDDVEIGSRDIHRYPFLFMTGHGYIEMNDREMENLRAYLENGGFLHVDDDYGFDPHVRPLLQEIFPDQELQELPGDHPLYRIVHHFPEGRPPKVHEHDGNPPQAFGLYHDGRLVLLYTYESNPSDGWAYDQHDNPQEITDAALNFGINLLFYVFTDGQ